jgi:ATP-binding cassette, subfamily B, bacterial CvaB/MchF/RaxB
MLQSEVTECGLACIAMVAAFFGHRVNLTGLRHRFPISAKGATLADLVQIASDLQLASRPLRLDVDEIGQLQVPAILHWDLNHFVVLERADGRGGALILDPAFGRKRVAKEELSRRFTGIALELTPTRAFEPIQARTRTRLTDLWSRLTNFRSATIQILCLSLLLQVTVLATPFFLQLTVDEAVAQADTSLILLLVIAFGAVTALGAVTRGLRAWVVLTVGQSLSYQLAGNIVRHLLRLPLDYFERRHVGDLLSRISSIGPIQALLSQGLVNVLIDTALASTTLLVMGLINPLLMALVLGTTLAYLLFSALLYPGLRARTEEELVARAAEETYLMESIRAIRSIKLHGAEVMRESAWRNWYADALTANYRSKTYSIQLVLAEDAIFGGQFLAVVAVGAAAVIQQDMTVGLLFAFLSFRSSFIRSATALVDQWHQWRLLGVHLDRLSDIVGQAPERLGPRSPRRPSPPPGIKVEAVSFAYGRNDPPLLDRLDLDIPRGAFVAIVGASGSGKTTLMRLMLGLLQPTSGAILVDGVPLGQGAQADWRNRIAAVLQDDQLLTGTLADNIAFFDPQADPRRIAAAAQRAQIHHDIMRMPMAYQSLVGDMGSALSGGQRQRLMLARALYRRPDVLFLDEGTANLDEAAENAVADAIEQLPITRIVVAHRPALVARADLVFRVRDGRVVPVLAPSPRAPAEVARRPARNRERPDAQLSLLVLESDPTLLEPTQPVLQGVGVGEVHNARSLMEAISILGRRSIDLVLVEFGAAFPDGLQFVRRVRESEAGDSERLPIMAMSRQADAAHADIARLAGADAFLSRPLVREELVRKASYVLRRLVK